MAPRKRTTPNSWNLCENCNVVILSKDNEKHISDCPPNMINPSHSFVHEETLYAHGDEKSNEEIKGLTPDEKNNMVFLSQSAIQLCNLAIGEYACVVEINKSTPSYARIVWPTAEKSLDSVLFTKTCMEVANIRPNTALKLNKVHEPICEAKKIVIVLINAPPSMDIGTELQTRLQKSHLNRLVATGNILGVMFYGTILKFEIKNVEGSDSLSSEFVRMNFTENGFKFFRITENTHFTLYKNELEFRKLIQFVDPFAQIGGLTEELEELKYLMDSAFGIRVTMPGLKLTRGVLLYGSNGTGKTMIGNAFAASTNVNVVRINAPDLYGKFSGTPEENIKWLFKEAKEHCPSLIFMDEVDILCPLRTSKMTEAEKRVVSCLLTELDLINEEMDGKIFILATTNKPDAIDSAFRRCGRFEREIEIPAPNPNARYDILCKLLREAPIENKSILKNVANDAHGFVGSDLVALCSRAGLHACQSGRLKLDEEDFKYALSRVRPSAMREVQVEVPNVKWIDIGGQQELKLILKQCVEWPLKHSNCFIRMGITPPRGILMYGPPGCSKTMIAKALATESGLNFIAIKGPELFSKWVGESERAVREVFRRARQVAPSIIFFDEIDAIGGERSAGSGSSNNVQERVLAQLLTEMDGVSPLGDVTILAATNRPDRIDKALLRPGRLDRIVYVPLPDEETRREIFKIKLRKMPVHGVDIEWLVTKTNAYSGAEVNAVCHEAAMMALEEDINAHFVNMRHFEKALDMISPRTLPSLISLYEEYSNQ